KDRVAALPKRLAAALDHRIVWRLEQADLLCREILEIQPGHPDALLIRALVALDAQDQPRAIELMRQASAADSQDPNLHGSRAKMSRSAAFLKGAPAESQRALALGP